MKVKRDVVAALIWDNDSFMICQRPVNKTRALQWEFVGGKTEDGETKEEALIRECKEEIGVTISVGDISFEVDHEYPDIFIHLTLFNCKIASGEIKMLEHNDIPQYEFCPADKDILEKLMNPDL